MQPPVTTELQRHLHDERVALLRSSMQRPSFAPRRAVGAWMVSVGVRLAPEALPSPRVLPGAESSEAPPCGPAAPLRVVS